MNAPGGENVHRLVIFVKTGQIFPGVGAAQIQMEARPGLMQTGQRSADGQGQQVARHPQKGRFPRQHRHGRAVQHAVDPFRRESRRGEKLNFAAISRPVDAAQPGPRGIGDAVLKRDAGGHGQPAPDIGEKFHIQIALRGYRGKKRRFRGNFPGKTAVDVQKSRLAAGENGNGLHLRHLPESLCAFSRKDDSGEKLCYNTLRSRKER